MKVPGVVLTPGRCLLLATLVAAASTCRAATNEPAVARVIDGDTFQLDDGRQVRYLGIDAPEKGDPRAEDAIQVHNHLVGGKKVRLEVGNPAEDRDGRVLAYVFLGKTLVNAELVRLGCAHLRRPIAAKHKELLLKAQEEARIAERGIWAKAAEVRLAVSQIHAQPSSQNARDFNDEYVVIENRGGRDLNMTGWTLSDEAHHRYLFPNFSLPAGKKVTVRTGLGSNTESDLFWGSRTAIWNDDGDTVFVKDASGHLLLLHIY